MQYDVFISHASEDKPGIVRDLAHALRSKRFSVWYDEFTLRVGDGLRASIDKGLAQSRFGIVVLSKAFFQKQWPKWELDGLLQRHLTDGEVILPIWHEVSKEEVAEFSPPLANLVSVSTGEGIDAVVAKLAAVIRPEKSSLEVAYDVMRAHGADPPPISDDWWLHVAGETYYPYSIGESWRIPYPECPDGVSSQGWELAWVGMNVEWFEQAEYLRISCTTHPSTVLEFIHSQPGLEAAGRASVKYLLELVPQLAIPGLGGAFEECVQEFYEESCSRNNPTAVLDDIAREVLGVREAHIPLDTVIVIQHPQFASVHPARVASKYCRSCHADWNAVKIADVMFWLMSACSEWIGNERRQYFLKGISEWAAWGWGPNIAGGGWDPEELRGSPNYGHFGRHLWSIAKEPSASVEPKAMALLDLKERIQYSVDVLQLPESVEEIVSMFLGSGILETWLMEHRARSARHAPDD